MAGQPDRGLVLRIAVTQTRFTYVFRWDVSRRDVYALAQRLVRSGLIEPRDHGENV